jgi:uncharacterized LabA/DUF88 family protein
MAIKIAVLIDGGFLRIVARKAQKTYDPDFIEKFAHACKSADEEIFRVLYYDCAPFKGTVKLPVSGLETHMSPSDAWLHELSHKNLFAVRRGVLKFRGYIPKKKTLPAGTPNPNPATTTVFTDADFKPTFEQKGVDMRIGLDVAAYSANHSVARIVLVSADTDCIPALKYGRRAGLQTVLVQPGTYKLTNELRAHADFTRLVPLP